MKTYLTALALSSVLVGCATQTADPCLNPSLSVPRNALLGINLSGAEFAHTTLPGRFNTNYTYPRESDMAYFAARGFTLIRLPFLWERVQPELNGPLNPAEVQRIHQALSNAQSHNLNVILDVHNFAKYNNVLIGTPEVPVTAFANLWVRLTQEFQSHPNIWAYGLMNEPVGLPKGVWPQAAQAAINEIRKHDPQTQILVPGEHWSSAMLWPKVNPSFPLTDPSNNLRYEAHTYFDKDNSGTYKSDYKGEGASVARADERLIPFINWLKQHDEKGFVGEFGVPANKEWQPVLARATKLMRENNIPSTYWSAGPWWGGYPLSIQPDKQCKDKPQLKTLLNSI